MIEPKLKAKNCKLWTAVSTWLGRVRRVYATQNRITSQISALARAPRLNRALVYHYPDFPHEHLLVSLSKIPRLFRRVVSSNNKLYSALSLLTQVYKWVPAIIMLGVTLRWKGIPSRRGVGGR